MANLTNPFPKVEINPMVTQVGHVWIGERTGGNGAAMWDSEYPVGVPEGSISSLSSGSARMVPNPCADNTTLYLELKNAENVSCSIFNLYGEKVQDISATALAAGSHSIPVDVSGLAAGCYLYEVRTAAGAVNGKLVVRR